LWAVSEAYPLLPDLLQLRVLRFDDLLFKRVRGFSLAIAFCRASLILNFLCIGLRRGLSGLLQRHLDFVPPLQQGSDLALAEHL